LNTSHLPTVYRIRAAIGPSDGVLSLMDQGRGPAGFRTWDDGSDPESSVSVSCVSVTSALSAAKMPHADLMKVDIEGAEFDLFAAADSWIDQINEVIVELHDRFRPGCRAVVKSALVGWKFIDDSEEVLHARRIATSSQ
jgi:FkbM family methyltransferase